MRRATSFSTLALAGYAAVTLLLAGGMALTIRGLGSVAATQVGKIRAKENEITIVERLRWRGELIVSDGRGYLLSADANLLAKVHEAEVGFDKDIQTLNKPSLSPREASLVRGVQQAAKDYLRVLEELVTKNPQAHGNRRLVQRFETELLPLRRALVESLDRLVDHKEDTIKGVYAQAERDQTRLNSRMYGLLGILALIGLGIASYFAGLLVRSFRKEHDALETARKALSARDELMGIVAHDLRNPLGAITMKAALLRKGAESERTQKHAESIENVAMRMEYLIRSMLDVATMEAGRFSVTPAPCNSEDLLREAIEMFENLSASKHIRLERPVKDSGFSIRADKERVLQVLSNLLGNAFKFAPQGGQVTISVARQGAFVRFGVSDTGPGIPSQNIPHVFVRFWKQETSGKKGTGLGLFIAKGIIDAHGGRIWVESHPGHGATFYFTVPVASESAVALPIESDGLPARA